MQLKDLLEKRPMLKSAARATLLKEARRAGVKTKEVEAYLAGAKPL